MTSRSFLLSVIIGICFWDSLQAEPKYFHHPAGHTLRIEATEEGGMAELRELKADGQAFTLFGELRGQPPTLVFSMPITYGDGNVADDPLQVFEGPGWLVEGDYDPAMTYVEVIVRAFEGDEKLYQPQADGRYQSVSVDEEVLAAKTEAAAAEQRLKVALDLPRDAAPPEASHLWELDQQAFDGGSAYEQSDPRYWRTLAENRSQQAQLIRAALGQVYAGSPWGSWRDGHGGFFEITEGPEAGELSFQVFVVRGPTAHVGELSGVAKFETPERAVWTDDDTASHIDGVAARLTFDFEDHVLRVGAENTSFYHGARAYFDGTYFFVGNE
ncbi:MAG: hypothetical protein ACFCU3_01275 [Verrucomicrobiales bacterium]